MKRARDIAWMLGSLLACGDSATGAGGNGPVGGGAEGAGTQGGAGASIAVGGAGGSLAEGGAGGSPAQGGTGGTQALGGQGGTGGDGGSPGQACMDSWQCPSGDCAVATCIDNVCGLEPVPAGTSSIDCFPYVCDGASNECPTICVDDGDCAGQTCSGGTCSALASCDLEWAAVHQPTCAFTPIFWPSTGFVGVDQNGSIYSDTHVPQVGGIVTWDLQQRSAAGSLANTWSGSDGLHNSCGMVLGPLGGLARVCHYSSGFLQTFSFGVLDFGWGDQLSIATPGSVGGSVIIDGANNVFYSATATDPWGTVLSEESVHDIAGNVLPSSTPQVPTSPPQTLPAGFDSTLLTQMVASDVRVDWAGNVSVSGTASGAVDLGGGVLTPISSLDIVIARFDPSGQHVWSERFAASSATATIVPNRFDSADGSIIVTGDFAGADFGFGPLAQSGTDQFVAKIDADGVPVCARSVTGSAVAGPAGEVVLVRNSNPLIIDGVSVGTLPACGGLVIGRLLP